MVVLPVPVRSALIATIVAFEPLIVQLPFVFCGPLNVVVNVEVAHC